MFDHQMIVKSHVNGFKRMLNGSFADDIHIEKYLFRNERKRVLALKAHQPFWVHGTREASSTSIEDCYGRLIVAYFPEYDWVGGELNTTACFDESNRLM